MIFSVQIMHRSQLHPDAAARAESVRKIDSLLQMPVALTLRLLKGNHIDPGVATLQPYTIIRPMIRTCHRTGTDNNIISRRLRLGISG